MDRLDKELQKVAKDIANLRKELPEGKYTLQIDKYHELSSAYAYYCHLNGIDYEFTDKDVIRFVENSA